MADNTPTTAADIPDQAQQNSPFMRLPIELRLRIYEFAFEDVVNEIESDVANKKMKCQKAETMWLPFSKKDHPVFVGVLSFLHVSRELRRESLDALLAPTKAFRDTCSYKHKVSSEARRLPVHNESGNLRHFKQFLSSYRLRRLNYDEALYRLQRMEWVCDAIALVAWETMTFSQRRLVRSEYYRR